MSDPTRKEIPKCPIEVCGNCEYAENGFYLFWCAIDRKNKNANETCHSFAPKDVDIVVKRMKWYQEQ